MMCQASVAPPMMCQASVAERGGGALGWKNDMEVGALELIAITFMVIAAAGIDHWSGPAGAMIFVKMTDCLEI